MRASKRFMVRTTFVVAFGVAGALSLPYLGAGDSVSAQPGDGNILAAATGQSYYSDTLVERAEQARARGWNQSQINHEIYAPFIIAGDATWTDTWGAPRSGPAPGQVRTHQGQDVFCTYGDSVLASEAGTLDYDEGGLGGKVARIHRSDGSYWYYAHLSEFSASRSSGDHVVPGDVIGYCGTSGNAATTPAHVHFGWYSASGAALDPMNSLVSWLRAAENDSEAALQKAPRKVVKPGKVKARRMDGGTQGTLELSIGNVPAKKAKDKNTPARQTNGGKPSSKKNG